MTGTHPPAPRRGIISPELLDQCISCGFCLPACPTYQLTGDEAASPRGRINLLRALEAGDLASDDPTLAEQSSFCLGCRACEPVCPAGVRYGTILEQWRDHQWRGRHRPLLVRLIAAVVRNGVLIRIGGWLRRSARTPAAGRLSARAARSRATAEPGPEASGHLMLGCVERVLFPRVSRAALRLAPELVAPQRQGCCGALHAHNGELARGQELARRLGRRLPGQIVTTSGGCAAHLASVLGADRVEEFSGYLAGREAATAPSGLGELRVGERRARVALQDSCHLRNALDGWRAPRELLRRVADYVELPDAAGCCGAAGTYALLRRRDSARVLAPKLDQIEAAKLDYVAVVNPGCLRQLQQGLRRRRSPVRAVHLAELLTWTQDPKPFHQERQTS